MLCEGILRGKCGYVRCENEMNTLPKMQWYNHGRHILCPKCMNSLRYNVNDKKWIFLVERINCYSTFYDELDYETKIVEILKKERER